MTTHRGPALEDADGIGARTLGGFLLEVTAAHAGREALCFDDPLAGGATRRWSYEALATESWRVAAGLVALGVPAGARVGILLGNRPEFASALFGVALAGAVAVPMSTFSTPAELVDLIDRSRVDGVLTQSRLRDRGFGDEVAELVERPAAEAAHLRWSAACGEASWDRFLDVPDDALVRARARATQVQEGDPGLILYSSGTTSEPKGVLHLHRAPTLQFWLQADVFRRTPDARVWAPLPLFWTAGLTTALGPTLARGGCVVLQEIFDAGEALALLARERVTEPYTLPHQAAALAEHPDFAAADLSSLREVYGKSVFTRHPRVTGDESWNMPVGWGMSETCASVVSHRWDTPRAEMRASTGRLLPGARLRVVDPDTGVVLYPGEHGEFWIDGHTVIDRYIDRPRDETLDECGFLATGDVGWVEADGTVHWTGRRSEMIKTGGANVSPAELEVALRACPSVRRARVLGIPDARLGEVVVLCVELADGSASTADDLRAFLAERVAAYKVPRHVLIFDADALPTNAAGTKVRDDVLVAAVLDRLGRAADATADRTTPMEDPR